MAELSIAERVANGVKWLDENKAGWRDRIDAGLLNIADPCQCVLGQAYGHYFRAPMLARCDGDDEFANYLADDRGFNGHEFELHLLTEEWRRVINAPVGAVSQ